MILDDILSSIDSQTEELIIVRLLGKNGLFRRLDTTVVLATHASKPSCQIYPSFGTDILQ